jgi:sigma-B regulation protein RsbU (phosphoserine phosphatase)
MKRKTMHFSLGKKLAALVVALCVVLSAVAVAVSYRTFSRSMTEYYTRLGMNLVQARSPASSIPSELDYYYQTGNMDDGYYKTRISSAIW